MDIERRVSGRINTDGQSKASVIVIAAYALLTLALLPRLSLWLDESIDLLGTQNASFGSIVEYASTNPGGAPVWYLTQALATTLLGYSTFAARLPACLASILSCCGIALLARRLGARWPALCVAVFATFPLQFRYALEGRPYAEGLCLSIWATLAFLRLIENPVWRNAVWYWALILVGLYTQPFSVFIAVAHTMWALGNGRLPPKVRVLTVGALSLAGAGFVPWLVYARRNWKGNLPAGAAHIWHPGLLAMLLRECLGGGYLLTGLVMVAVLLGVRSQTLSTSMKKLMGLMALVPVVLALLADSWSGYFVAIRQMIFILPSLALVACAGLEHVAKTKSGRRAALAAAVVTVSLTHDVRWFFKPREDWKKASDVTSQSARAGACAVLAPERTAQIFLFYHPGLIRDLYGEGADFSACSGVVVVMPDASPDWTNSIKRLTEAGFRRSRVVFAGPPTVRLLSR